MKILNVFNKRQDRGGEDSVFESVTKVLKDNDINVIEEVVAPLNYSKKKYLKIKALFSGIYSFSSKKAMKKRIDIVNPDVIHVHNLYPSISPSIFIAAKEKKTPIVYHSHNFFLTCPIGSHNRNNKPCKKCIKNNALSVIRYNCRGNAFESIGYWLRFIISKKMAFFEKWASRVIVVSEFAKEILVESGFSADKIVVLPNSISNQEECLKNGSYIGYAGRLTEDKGIEDFIAVAQRMPELSFAVAGDGPLFNSLKKSASENVKFLGWLGKDELVDFYQNAKMVVVPSRCYETFGLVAADAMSKGIPVIVANLGALPEVVAYGKGGRVYEVNNIEDLCLNIELLDSDIDLARKLGREGRIYALHNYSEEVYFNKLMSVYKLIKNV